MKCVGQHGCLSSSDSRVQALSILCCEHLTMRLQGHPAGEEMDGERTLTAQSLGQKCRIPSALILNYQNSVTSLQLMWKSPGKCQHMDSQWALAVSGFPGDSGVKNPPANAGDSGLIPGSGRSPGDGNGNPLQYPCVEHPMDRRAWLATDHGVEKETDVIWGLNHHHKLSLDDSIRDTKLPSEELVPASHFWSGWPKTSVFNLILF